MKRSIRLLLFLLLSLFLVTITHADDHLRKPISGTKVTISRPVAGTTTDDPPKIECPFSSHYGVYAPDGDPWAYWSTDLGTYFNFGETRRLSFTLSAETEYYFPEGKAPVIIGGTLVDYSVSNDPGFSLMDVTVDMPVTSHELPGYAVVTGVKEKVVYTGKAIKQNPVVTMVGEKLRSGIDYAVSYKNNMNVGFATIKITGLGVYKKSNPIYVYFEISPKATAINSVSPAKGGFILQWKKQAAGTTGYQIQYSTDSKFKSKVSVNITKNSVVKKTISKLKSKKKYYVRIRTYTKNGNSKYYSAWSKVKAVVTK